jgi:nitroreductase
MNETIALLARRRSLAPAQLMEPGPDAAELRTLLSLASRVPDHGKLAPWRFIVFGGAARDRAGRLALEVRLAADPELDEASRQAELSRFNRAPLVVAIVSRVVVHPKVPEWEQVLSAGAVAMSLTVAAKALGFASIWLTEWCAYDSRFREGLGLAEPERIAGFVHIGRPRIVPEDRPRPALAEIVTYFPS